MGGGSSRPQSGQQAEAKPAPQAQANPAPKAAAPTKKQDATACVDVHPKGGMTIPANVDDVVIVGCGAVGKQVGEDLQKQLQPRWNKVWNVNSPPRLDELESRCMAAKDGVVVILSEGCMDDPACVLSILLSDAKNSYGYEHNQRVILLHIVDSCPFPQYSTMPRSRTADGSSPEIASAFNSKAIPSLYMYQRTSFEMVAKRLSSPKQVGEKADGHGIDAGGTVDPKDLAPIHLRDMGKSFRLFLSHKQITGRYAIHRIHEALKLKFRIFLDVETNDLDLHSLVQLVEQTHTLVCYLSEDYLHSEFCVLELCVALVNNLHIVWVRDAMFRLGTDFDADGNRFRQTLAKVLEIHATLFESHGDVESLVRGALRGQLKKGDGAGFLVYHQELFEPFCHELSKCIGASDAVLELFLNTQCNLRVVDDDDNDIPIADFVETYIGKERKGFFPLDLKSLVVVEFNEAIPHTAFEPLLELSLLTSSMKTLGLADCSLGTQGAQGLGFALLKFGSALQLQTLDLKDNDMGCKGVAAISQALLTNSTLTSLDLSRNNVGPAGFKAISKVVAAHPRLVSVNLSGNDPYGEEGNCTDSAGVFALAKAACISNSLQVLHVVSYGLSIKDLKHEAFINFANRGLRCADIVIISALLVVNPNMTSLTLSENTIGPKGADRLAEAVKQTTTLHNLFLYDTELGDQGIKLIAEALKANKSLQSLDVSNNNITSMGAKDLAKALEANTSLLSLLLSENNIHESGLFDNCPNLEVTGIWSQ